MASPHPATGPAVRPEPGRSRVVARLALTRTAVAHLLLAVPALPLFVVVAVAIPLSVITVGVVVLMAAVPASHALASAHRALASSVLGEAVERPYRPVEGPGGARPAEHVGA